MKVVYNHSGTYKAVQPLLVGIAEDQRPFTGGYKRSSKWPCLKPQRLALRESRPSELPDHLADVSHSSRNVHGAQGIGDALEDVQRLLPGLMATSSVVGGFAGRSVCNRMTPHVSCTRTL